MVGMSRIVGGAGCVFGVGFCGLAGAVSEHRTRMYGSPRTAWRGTMGMGWVWLGFVRTGGGGGLLDCGYAQGVHLEAMV